MTYAIVEGVSQFGGVDFQPTPFQGARVGTWGRDRKEKWDWAFDYARGREPRGFPF